MLSSLKMMWVFVGLLFLVPQFSTAQWSADPTVNLSIADGSAIQVLPLCVPTSDGGCYVGWFDLPETGEYYRVFIQRLSPSGEELLPHNGVLVSDHPSKTYLYDWEMIVDREDNAVLVFCDTREGDFRPFIYKIDSGGNLLWGPDGIALANNDKVFWGFPSLTEAANGDIVVVWPEGEVDTAIMMQRLSPDGDLLLGDGALQIGGQSAKNAYTPKVIPSDEDNVIVVWSPDYNYSAKRRITAQKFDPAGIPLWADQVDVMDRDAMVLGTFHSLLPDGEGGGFLAWTKTEDLKFTCQVQHLTSQGIELFPHNGLNAFPESDYQQIYPTLNHDPATGEIWLFSRSQNGSASACGLKGQKLTSEGIHLWGLAGREFLPVDDTLKFAPRSLLVPGSGAMVFQVTGYSQPVDEDILIGALVNDEGDFVWPEDFVVMSSILSDKSDLRVIMGSDGMGKTFWSDRRNGAGDIYGQNINLDGTLGGSPSTVFDLPTSSQVAMSVYPNPSNPGMTIRFDMGVSQAVSLNIYSVDGRLVRTLVDEVRSDGRHEEYWDGRGTDGLEVSAGVYFSRLEIGDFAETKHVALIK
ncbi:MAG: T9SS type A sorting domain-containing protein [Gemmatimonadales bacterium]|nr:T9SS type A sorting domain-containing protein [Gemmatimonadales bacterium]